MIRIASLVLVFTLLRDGIAEQKTVRAEIAKDAAWTGEAVPLIITLYSPGPFSGTASFDLPELPRTAILRGSNPLVGSEEVDGESYFTQRHELTVYTQIVGDIVIPAFRVRFSGKTTFTSDPKPMEGLTPELRFQSNRPPGTARLGVVVAATDMEVTQTWKPDVIDAVNAGDVLERIITRRATATTAMMFPPLSTDAPDGVREYLTDPVVQDNVERGAATAERSETIKYQFERPGTFPLPDLSLVWWDPQASELKRKILPGETINVAGTVEVAAAPARPSSRRSPAIVLLGALAMGLAIWLLGRPAWRFLAKWQARRNNPEARSTRRLLSACRAGDAPAAYTAMIDWKRAVSGRVEQASLDELAHATLAADLPQEWAALSEHVFGIHARELPWSGRRLAEAFVRMRHGLNQTRQTRCGWVALPALNPTAPSRWKAPSDETN